MFFLLDGAYGRYNLIDRWTILKGLVAKWSPKAVGYEKYGKDTEIESMENYQEEDNFRFTIVPLGGLMNKNERIKKWCVPRLHRREWLFPHAIWVDDQDTNQKINLIDRLVNKEMLPWPLISHDDLFDNLSRADDPQLGVQEPYEGQAMSSYQENEALRAMSEMGAEVPM